MLSKSVYGKMQYVLGTPIKRNPEHKRICHDIVIKNGIIEHPRKLTNYLLCTSPSSLSIQFPNEGLVVIDRVALFMTGCDGQIKQKPIIGDVRNIVIGGFDEEETETKTGNNMEISTAIEIMEHMVIDIRTNHGYMVDSNPLFAWNPYWTTVFGPQNPALIDPDPLDQLHMLPMRIGWVCHANFRENPYVIHNDIEINIKDIKSHRDTIKAQFQIDVIISEER